MICFIYDDNLKFPGIDLNKTQFCAVNSAPWIMLHQVLERKTFIPSTWMDVALRVEIDNRWSTHVLVHCHVNANSCLQNSQLPAQALAQADSDIFDLVAK